MSIELSIKRNDLNAYIKNQLKTFFPDNNLFNDSIFNKSFSAALDRIEFCFARINSKYFSDGNNSLFNHLNGDHYSMFLYFLSNALYKEKADLNICSKIFLLNKYLHGIDAFYEVELPNIFLFVHPLGTVLGRGKYSDYFIVYQRCNIGSNKDIYPSMGEHLTLHPGSAVLGNCVISDNCKIAAHSLLLDKNLDTNTLYIGTPKSFTIKKVINKNPIWK